MLTILATRSWILLVVSEDGVSHSSLMNNYGFSGCLVGIVSSLASEISADVTSLFIWVSIPVVRVSSWS